MSERDNIDEVEVEETSLDDELDSWFEDGDEDDEDQSAEEETVDEEDSSPSEETEEPDPDNEDPEDDATDTSAASAEGDSTDNRETEYPYDWMGALDEDLRKEVEKIVHSERSQKGRVAALRRQLDEVRSEQEARERTVSQASATAAAGDKKLEDMNDVELEEFLEEFPSVGKNVQKLIDRRLEEELTRRVQPLEQQRLQQDLMERRQRLRMEAERIFNTVETGIDLDDVLSSNAFREWVNEQPAEYRQFASTAESVDAASKVLEDFARYAEAQVAAQIPADAEEESTQKADTRSADQTAARRQQARKGATPRSKSAELTNKPGQGSYEDWFDHFASGGE
jgi:hypothetical protein